MHMQAQVSLARKVCEINWVQLTEDQFALLMRFVTLVQDANVKVNLVSRKDIENILIGHVLHSLSLLFLFEIPYGAVILDLGSGGGFPGIPLSIVREDLKFTLLDSVAKKTSVLGGIVADTGLTNAIVLTGRAEALEEQLSGQFDIVLARGVAPLGDLIRWCRPLLARRVQSHAQPGTCSNKMGRTLNLPCLLAFKGGDLEDEIADARMKTGRRTITEVDLVYPGVEDLGLEDKKIVVVEF